MILEYRKDNFLISTDRSRLDLEAIHDFLKNAYWAQNIPFEVVRKSIQNSLCYGVYDGERQVGLARVITDYATFAYLTDVFIVESHQRRGLGAWLMECVMAHPDLQNLRMFILATRDAHELYRKVGFENMRQPERWMVIHKPDVYQNTPSSPQFPSPTAAGDGGV